MQIFISFVVEIFNIIKSNSTGTKNIPQFHFTILDSPDQRVKDRGGSLYLADLCLEVVQPAGVRVVVTGQVRHPPATPGYNERHQLGGVGVGQLEYDGGSPAPTSPSLVAGPEVLDLGYPVVAVLLRAGLLVVLGHSRVLVLVLGVTLV